MSNGAGLGGAIHKQPQGELASEVAGGREHITQQVGTCQARERIPSVGITAVASRGRVVMAVTGLGFLKETGSLSQKCFPRLCRGTGRHPEAPQGVTEQELCYIFPCAGAHLEPISALHKGETGYFGPSANISRLNIVFVDNL